MSLSLFKKMLEKKHLVISSTSAPKLAEALLTLFDNENSQVQLLAIYLFRKVMELVVDEGKGPLKTIVNQSLLLLFLHCHEENQDLAEAFREALNCAAGFLGKTDLQKEQPLKIDECLRPRGLFSRLPWARAGCPWSPGPAGLWAGTAAPRAAAGPLPPALGSPWPAAAGSAPQGSAARGGRGRPQAAPGPGAEPAPTLPSCRSLQLPEDRSRAAQQMQWALRFLDSPQESVREAALRIIGMVGRCLRGKRDELRAHSPEELKN
ncbi:uncharacterized protein LOC141730415 [Zonotrichia albicollis]|uniref:uncharacterized protein LOC141730415 n=1 Tax=Zonotrichia albicollis TaxID=44394 RepID=UPI003D80BF3F